MKPDGPAHDRQPRSGPYRPARHMVQTVDPVCDCDKQAYLSELLAANAAVLIRLAGGRAQRPYRCPAGPDWHLTSRPAS